LSLFAVAAISSGVAVVLTIGKLKVQPIGPVKVVNAPSEQNAKPISQITVSGTIANRPEYVGWVVNLDDLCKKSEYSIPLESSVILIQTDEGITAATTKLSPKACETIGKLVAKRPERTTIYAASDTPFSGMQSELKYVKLKPGDS
jgi:hypothetical protein